MRINKNLFITSSIDRKIQFFYIDIVDEFSDHNQIEGEWSPPIKEIKETISFIYKLNDKEILLLGVRGDAILFQAIILISCLMLMKRLKLKGFK